MTATARLLLLATLAPLAGCGSGAKYAPVTGDVKMDGKPLAGAMVVFQPVAANGVDSGGVGSTARTDAAGHYELQASTPDPQPGAFVGKHAVRIATPPPAGSSAADDSDAAQATGKKPFRDPIPERYNTETTLSFDVPPGGSQAANFDLDSGKKK